MSETPPKSRWPLDWPKAERPATAQIVAHLFRTRNFIWDNDHRTVADFGLTWSQLQTLIALRSAPDQVLAPTQIYGAAQVSSGGLTKMLIGLTAEGHVERLKNPDDKRSKLVKLTPKGATLVEDVVFKLMETNQALIGSILEEEEYRMLERLLSKLHSGLLEQKG